MREEDGPRVLDEFVKMKRTELGFGTEVRGFITDANHLLKAVQLLGFLTHVELA